jgi:hypothetical protein
MRKRSQKRRRAKKIPRITEGESLSHSSEDLSRKDDITTTGSYFIDRLIN